MLDDIYFMKQALIEAGKAAERGEVPVGAVVVCKERIIARAHNLTETLNDVTAHAEMQAITAAANVLGGKYLNECTLYVLFVFLLATDRRFLQATQSCDGNFGPARYRPLYNRPLFRPGG